MTCAAPDRIYSQYRTRTKARQWYAITEKMAAGLCSAAELVSLSYDLDNATSDMLDVIGRIVVIDRSIAADILLPTYQFEDDIGDDYEFGDGEIQFSETSVKGDRALSDAYYRTLIRSKIARNNTDATIEGILASAEIIVPGADRFIVYDHEDMSFTLEISGKITEIERALIFTAGVLPKPQGVRLAGLIEPGSFVQFGIRDNQFGVSLKQFLKITGA